MVYSYVNVMCISHCQKLNYFVLFFFLNSITENVHMDSDDTIYTLNKTNIFRAVILGRQAAKLSNIPF